MKNKQHTSIACNVSPPYHAIMHGIVIYIVTIMHGVIIYIVMIYMHGVIIYTHLQTEFIKKEVVLSRDAKKGTQQVPCI